jgi:glucoamylase
MPLVWAHSEYIKLLRSLHEKAVWDLPAQTVERYLKQGKTADFQIWTTNQRRAWLAPGKALRVDLVSPANVQWTVGKETQTLATHNTGFQLHSVKLPLGSLTAGSGIKVTITPGDEGAAN